MKDVLLSVAPIAWLVVALSVLKLKAWQATATALAVAIAIALVFFRAALPPSSIPSVAAEGVAFALCPICLVVLAALFTYAVTVESGAMENIRRGLTEVSDDRRVLALQARADRGVGRQARPRASRRLGFRQFHGGNGRLRNGGGDPGRDSRGGRV